MNNYKKIILNNGIPLYLYNNPSLKQVYVGYIIKYGSSGRWYKFNLDSKDYKVGSGYAHYLEHLLGEHSKYGNIYTNFDNRFYDANAYTSYNHTCYHFTGVDDIKKSIKELIEAIDSPVFDKKDVNQSRHAICEEASTWQDKYDIHAVNLVEKNLFSSFDEYDHTLSPIGNRKTTKEITTEGLYDCYNAFYTDNNKVLVIAGNVNEQELVDYLNEIYSNIKSHKSNLVLPNYDLDPIRKVRDEIKRRIDVDINSFGIKIKRPEGVSKEELNTCITFIASYLLSSNSKFNCYLKDENLLDLIDYVYTRWYGDYIQHIHSYVSNDPEEYLKTLRGKLEKRDMSYEDFECLRKSLIAEAVRDLDDKYSIPADFGRKMPYADSYSDLEMYKHFTYERFMEIINKLEFDKYTIGKVIKLSK